MIFKHGKQNKTVAELPRGLTKTAKMRPQNPIHRSTVLIEIAVT